MRTWKWALLVAAAFCAGCNSLRGASLGPERAAAVDREVRAFVTAVAHDVTQEGPSAWRKHFSDGPTFFMAVDGHLQFPDSASATAGIQEYARLTKHIELQWGDVRVDPLSERFAVVAAPWHEIVDNAAGQRTESGGYFTGLAERRNGRWQFRNAHWSTASPTPAEH
jgi:hypothetical protein